MDDTDTLESRIDTVKTELRQSLISLVNHTLESSVDTAKNELRQSLISLVDEKINDILIEYKKYLDGYDNHYTQLREEKEKAERKIEVLNNFLKSNLKSNGKFSLRLVNPNGRKGGSFSKYKTRKRIKKINNIKIKKHAKKHTRRHMIHMKKMMKKGYSFKNAHKSAMYKVGK